MADERLPAPIALCAQSMGEISVPCHHAATGLLAEIEAEIPAVSGAIAVILLIYLMVAKPLTVTG